MVRQRLMLGNAGSLDLAYYDGVIPTWIGVHDATLDRSERAVQQGHSGCAVLVSCAVEPILILGRESAGEMLLVLGQDVDRKVATLGQIVVNGRALVHTSKHQRRFQRNGGERIHGYPRRAVVGACSGDYRDAGDKPA